jgi:hypothetical protein
LDIQIHKKKNSRKRRVFREAIEIGRRGEVVSVNDLAPRLVELNTVKSISDFYKYFPVGSKLFDKIKNAVEVGKSCIRLQIKAMMMERGSTADLQFIYKMYATEREAQAIQRFSASAGARKDKIKAPENPPMIVINNEPTN